MKNTKSFLACTIGNIIEWYEFIVFGYFAHVIGAVFFPASSPLLSLFKAFGVFAIGIMVRPLGGILFGHIGDKFGRKSALYYSMILMSVPTFMIGLLPTYENIGIWASILLILIRLLQGLAMGGEYAGTMTYLVEGAEPKNKGFYGSIAALSLVLGMALGSLLSAFLHNILSPEQMFKWGWRIPFFISSIGIIWAIYLRLNLKESKGFLEFQKDNPISKLPIKEAFSKDLKPILIAIIVQCYLAVGMYTLTVFYSGYAQQNFKDLSPLFKGLLNTPGVLLIGIAALIFGKLSDKWGRKKILTYVAISAIFLCLFSVPLLEEKDVSSFLIVHLSLSFLTGAFLGPIPSFLADCFSVKTRYTCIALSNNLSMGIFGGTAPMVITYLMSVFYKDVVPVYYLMLSAGISFIGLLFIKDIQGEKDV
ncbi:MAG: MFS transporter [Alphaproteobacteria bacterium]|nr:MFS transporter [Alphaproteobacteria bacterium]